MKPTNPCTEPVCITCGDVAQIAVVTEVLADRRALVELDGVTEEISVALVDASCGDILIVHAKEALGVLG